MNVEDPSEFTQPQVSPKNPLYVEKSLLFSLFVGRDEIFDNIDKTATINSHSAERSIFLRA